ncbi:sensor histidine kinase [Natronobiforma cellulositropha]|uniref:sensor histidine kinase n=1 Tax=Natronobiforma cellulositropha TaxID=1679076 RepID=UPI0021D5D7AD|nr:histidine kinase N-terminal 7TM domain-containing protein [Natronobiforma cellulositropha]
MSILDWQWYYTPFVPLLLVAAALTGVIAWYAWRNRDAPGGTAFAVLMLAMSLWATAYSLQLAGANESTKLFWANLVHVGVATVPVAWFCFTLEFTGRGHWVTKRAVAALAVVPAAYVGAVYTNEHHGLVRESLGVEAASESLLVFRQVFGPVFWAHAAYGYVLMTAGVVVLAQLLFWSPRVYQRQAGLLLVGAVLSMVANTVHHAGLSPIVNFDLTPFSFPLIGVAYLVAIAQYRLLDLTPIAREFVVDTLEDGVVVVDRDGRIVDLNGRAATIIGLEATEVVGRRFGVLTPMAASLAGRPATDGTLETETVVDGDGGRRHVTVVSAPVLDGRGEALGRSIVVRDVTVERELEAEVEATLERLRRSNDELEAFTSVASHDLREPLRTTDNYLALLEESASTLTADEREFLETARRNCTRMQTMITDLLEYARIETTDDEFGPVDCDRVVSSVLETVRFDIEEGEATVTVDALPTVWGVEHLLRRLFQNLLSNALKYTDGSPEIHVFADRTGDEWTITVRDDGVGMTPGEAERARELFVRADRTDAAPGSGVGLAVCEKIVDYHGGSLAIESTPGVGTDVRVTLPADRQRSFE